MRRASLFIPLLLAGLGLAQLAAPPAPGRPEILGAARDVMRQAHYATFITVSEDGQPQARVLDPSDPDADFTVWLGTRRVTRKVAQVQKNPRATLFYFDKGSASYVSLIGSAKVVSDPAEKERHWQPRWAPFYPGGPADKDFVLIRFAPRTLEIVSPARDLPNDPQTWRPVVLELR